MQVKAEAVLPLKGLRAFLANLGLLAAALALPAAAHLLEAPVRWLLPMHWPVVLAGLVYGWRGGLAVGFLAPLASFALSGLPTVAMLPVMTAELAVYGFLAGFLRERLDWNGHLSTGLALVGGRLIFMGFAALLTPYTGSYWGYLAAALLPGMPAALGMTFLLPPLARWWVEGGS